MVSVPEGDETLRNGFWMTIKLLKPPEDKTDSWGGTVTDPQTAEVKPKGNRENDLQKTFFCSANTPFPHFFFFFFSSLPASLQGPLLAVEAHIWILWANTSKRTTQWRPLKAPPERDDGGLHEARCFLPLPSSCHGCYGIWRSRGRGENTTFVISLRNFTLNLFFCCPSSTLAILLMFNCCVGLQ